MKNSTSDQFSMELKYNDGTLPQFNGNISGQNYTNGTANAFTYSYDRLNRLTNAAAGNNLGEAISYDVMGNITSLARGNFGLNNYTGYDGNRLTAINGFTNGTYSYDVNGNQKTNTARGITNIDYNYMNLPVSIVGPNVSYTYNAAGEKLQKQAGGTVTNYIDGIQYTNNIIDFIQTEEGLARRSGNSYSYEYNLADHLGNIRVTFYQNPTTNQLEVLQRDDYYAFGLRKEPVAKAGLNKYLYNGKELQEELGQYDYGARFYDPVIGRWNVVDPKAEMGRRWSPYTYAFNDPIRFIDPDGMWAKPGDLFKTADAAAQDFGKYYNGQSIIEGKEFLSFTYVVRKRGQVYYTYTSASGGGNSRASKPLPKGVKVVAIDHTHGKYERGYANNVFSGSPEAPGVNGQNTDIKQADDRKMDIYVATPNGSLQKYDRKNKTITTISTDMPSDPNDPTRLNTIPPKAESNRTNQNVLPNLPNEAKIKLI
jgi:RHS repeat-associated protein